MIIDDESLNLFALKGILKKIFKNIKLIEAVDGVDGFEKFK